MSSVMGMKLTVVSPFIGVPKDFDLPSYPSHQCLEDVTDIIFLNLSAYRYVIL
jgi:hypothetical protein